MQMKLGKIVLFFAVVVASAVAAADVPNSSSATGRLIWNDLREGMTKLEVKALYPKSNVELGEGCFADLFPEYSKSRLIRVNLEWSTKDQNERCGQVVLASLVSKYGNPPISETEIKANDCGNKYAGGIAGALSSLCEVTGGDEPDLFSYGRWLKDGVEITFKRDSGDDGKWWLVYRSEIVGSASVATKL